MRLILSPLDNRNRVIDPNAEYLNIQCKCTFTLVMNLDARTTQTIAHLLLFQIIIPVYFLSCKISSQKHLLKLRDSFAAFAGNLLFRNPHLQNAHVIPSIILLTSQSITKS